MFIPDVYIVTNKGVIKINSISYIITNSKSNIVFKDIGNIFFDIVIKPHSYIVFFILWLVFLFI